MMGSADATSIVVGGAGIVGVATAINLLRAGRRVVLPDKTPARIFRLDLAHISGEPGVASIEHALCESGIKRALLTKKLS